MRDRQGIVRLNHNKKNELQIYTMFRVRQSHIDFYSKRQRVVVLGTRNPSSTVRCSSMAIRVVGLYYEIESFESMLAMWYSRTIGENRHTTIIQSLHVCWSHCMYNDQGNVLLGCIYPQFGHDLLVATRSEYGVADLCEWCQIEMIFYP